MMKYDAEKYFNVLTTAANVSVSHDEMKRPKSRGCWKYLSTSTSNFGSAPAAIKIVKIFLKEQSS